MLDFTLYAFVIVLGHALAALPVSLALALGRVVGWLTFHVARIRRRVVLANVRYVLPDRSDAEVRAIGAAAYEHLGMMLVEVLRCAVVDPKRRNKISFRREDIDGFERLKELKAAHKPAIICTPHHANFDVGCYLWALEGLTINIVMKPLESARFNRFIKDTRERYGHRMLMKEGDLMPELAELLRRGEWVGLLPDQNAKKRGVTVDWLGKPASIYKGAAALHLETGAQIVLAIGERDDADPKRMFIRTVFMEPFAPTADHVADVHALMQKIADRMGEVILRTPEQYFWFHRLWGKQLAAVAKNA